MYIFNMQSAFNVQRHLNIIAVFRVFSPGWGGDVGQTLMQGRKGLVTKGIKQKQMFKGIYYEKAMDTLGI